MAESILVSDFRNGRNGFDPPHVLPVTQAVEAVNVDWYGATLGRRRGGTTSVSLTGGTAPGAVKRLFRFQPGAAETAAELWLFAQPSATVIPKRLAGGTSWADVSGVAITAGTLPQIEALGLDGRFYIAAPTAVSGFTTGSIPGYVDTKLLVYDPDYPGGAQIRWVGFDAVDILADFPSAANTGVGTVAAVARKYRIRYVQKVGDKIIRRSEPSISTASFTPSGTGLAVRVTRATPPGVGETHWELEAGDANQAITPFSYNPGDTWNYYRIATIAIATTFYDDTGGPSGYSFFPLSEDYGEHFIWQSVRYLITDHNRLIGAGNTTSGNRTSRVFFSPVLGASDAGDVERVPLNGTHQNYLDFNENDGGSITGLGPAINGAFYVFKRRQIWRVAPTGDDVTPYRPTLITTAFGAISHASVVAGRDVNGNPCIYFWSEEGPCRLIIFSDGTSSIQYLGHDIQDYTSQITFASFDQSYPHALFFAGKHQVWFWFNYVNGGSTYPIQAVFDVMAEVSTIGNEVRGGWSIYSDFTTSPTMSHGAVCSVPFANTLGASMSADLKPYLGLAGSGAILKADTADPTDNGQNFQAYVRSRPLDIQPFGDNVGVGVCSLLADVASGVTLTLSLIRDYGLETRTSTVLLTAAASETKVIRKFEAAEMSGAGTIQFQLGDGAAVSATQWKIHELALTIFPQEPR